MTLRIFTCYHTSITRVIVIVGTTTQKLTKRNAEIQDVNIQDLIENTTHRLHTRHVHC